MKRPRLSLARHLSRLKATARLYKAAGEALRRRERLMAKEVRCG